MLMQAKPDALGVFIYAGGFTLGVREHFNVVAHLEDGRFGVATVQHNMPEIEVNSDPDSWRKTYDRLRGSIKLVHSNPPCAPWSMAGRAVDGNRGLTNRDERVKCVFQSYNVFESVQADAWIWESVARTATAGRPLIEQLAERGARRGYKTTVVVFQGQDLGIPQVRKRTFVVQHNFHIDWERPNKPRRVVRDVLGPHIEFDEKDMASMSAAESAIIPHTLPGGSLRDTFNSIHGTPLVHPDRKVIRGRPSFIRRRLHWDRPSFTVVGGPHLFHPEEDRILSVQEVAAICCYPQDYEFIGSKNDRYAQVAKAVLPPAGEWIASNVRRGLDEDYEVDDTTLSYRDFSR